MKIITLYEAASTDGYTDSPDGLFYLHESEAKKCAERRHKYMGRVISHTTVADIDGKYYLLKRVTPIALANSPEHIEQLKEAALKKLTENDKRVLGLI